MSKEKNDQMKQLTDDRVRDILTCEASDIDKDVFIMKLHQAKLGMSYIRDREIMKRVTNGHTLRIISMITSDEEERRDYVTSSMPEFHVVKQLEG